MDWLGWGMGKFKKGHYRSDTTRLKDWDYAQNAAYFITICTHRKEHFLGTVRSLALGLTIDSDLLDSTPQNFAALRTYLNPSRIGEIAYEYWLKIPQKYPFVSLGEFVIMPNHVHGILIFNRKEKLEWQSNRYGPQSQNLAAVIRGYKAGVKSFATKNKVPFAWQSRYYDHIIRDQKAYHQISRYIQTNPVRWHHP
ncbi:MAG: hypothetical protein AAFN10_14675 [Bacteroidota bacterium]